jgi:P-type Cu+ transporter
LKELTTNTQGPDPQPGVGGGRGHVMNAQASVRPAIFGLLAFGLMLVLYFAVLTLVSGWQFTRDQFSTFWFYVVALGAGFGLQVALYVRLRQLLHESNAARSVMAASGATSSAAMVSCCAHYLVNLAPVLAATGLVSFAAQYQLEFFWVGLAFNAAGVAYIGNKLRNAVKAQARRAHV